MPNNIAFTLLSYWSRNVTVFYFIQWILICWALAVLDEKRYGVVTTIILMAAIILSADLLTRLYGILAVKTEYSLRRTRAGFLVK
jgi:hypothetical protein